MRKSTPVSTFVFQVAQIGVGILRFSMDFRVAGRPNAEIGGFSDVFNQVGSVGKSGAGRCRRPLIGGPVAP